MEFCTGIPWESSVGVLCGGPVWVHPQGSSVKVQVFLWGSRNLGEVMP